jgi:DNA-binding transcriptional MerR regulator
MSLSAVSRLPPECRYTISDLAEEFGLTLRCIRFYEDEGLLSPLHIGQTRFYSYADHARLKLICRGKRLGFSIAEIKQFLDLYAIDHAQTGQMQFLLGCARKRMETLTTQMEDIRQTLAELQQIERDIVNHLDQTNTAEKD